jgi:hypothetical protein
VHDCFVLQMFRYVEGRDESPADGCGIFPLQNSFAAQNRPIAELLLDIVLADSFLRRSYEP